MDRSGPSKDNENISLIKQQTQTNSAAIIKLGEKLGDITIEQTKLNSAMANSQNEIKRIFRTHEEFKHNQNEKIEKQNDKFERMNLNIQETNKLLIELTVKQDLREKSDNEKQTARDKSETKFRWIVMALVAIGTVGVQAFQVLSKL